MVIFKTLSYKNFLSSGDKLTTIDLDSTSTSLIVGLNGSGKSSMTDALSFVLFNKPHRNINRPQLVNSINNKKCLVTIEFEIGSSKYKVERGIKPNIFEIWQDGKKLNQDSHSRDYQKFLETNILKLNYKSFHQVVVLGSSNFVPFMQLPTYHRRNVIEDLLDIGIFTKMNTLLKEANSKHKDLIKDTEHQLNLVNEKIKLQTKHLNDLIAIDERNNQKIQQEIDERNHAIELLSADNLVLTTKYKEEIAIAQAEVKKQQETLNTLNKYEHGIKYKIDEIVKDAKFYENNTSCPTCEQKIDDLIKTTKLAKCKENASELNKGYIELRNSINDAKDSLAAALAFADEVQLIQSKISLNSNAIANHNKCVASAARQLNEKTDENDTSHAKLELTQLKELKNKLAEIKINQVEDRLYNDVISELLKDTGIKTKIIKQYLPVMNKLINQYLQILDFFVSFNLDESFTETIKSRHRDDFSYASFSEGEKARIDLALLFAWRQIAKMKNSAATNLLILDEVFDSSLDSDGVENLMQILGTLESTSRTFIISHKRDLLEGKFDRKLEFQKVKNFSVLKSD